MDLKIILFFVISVFCREAFAQAASARVPEGTLMLVSIKGEGVEIKNHGERVKLRQGMRLVQEAQVEMKEFSLAEFVSAGGDQFFIYGPSQINFLFLQGDGSLLINLQKGQMRWASSALRDDLTDKSRQISKTLLKTDLVELELNSADAGFLYDAQVPRVEVFNMRGSSVLRVRESFESVRLEGKQKAYFQGVIENGEIVYDLLLQGKKIPKGILSPAIALSAEEEKIFIPLVKARPKKQTTRITQDGKVIQVKGARPARKTLCSQPSGDLNQCSWTCEGLKKGKQKTCPTQQSGVNCVRRKCDANGTWRDEFILPADAGKSKCKVQPIVMACDY